MTSSTLTRILLASWLSAAALFAQPAYAEIFKKGPSVFNYNLVELKYFDADGVDGFSLVGAGDIRDNIALRVNYVRADSDADGLRFGAVYYIQSQSYPRADLNFAAGLDRVEDESGVYASAGTRYAFSDVIELNAAVELTTVVDTDLNIQLGGLYELSPGFSALLETTLGDNSAISIGARFYWR